MQTNNNRVQKNHDIRKRIQYSTNTLYINQNQILKHTKLKLVLYIMVMGDVSCQEFQKAPIGTV